MSGYCPDCGNTLCICDNETKSTYPYRFRIQELEAESNKWYQEYKDACSLSEETFQRLKEAEAELEQQKIMNPISVDMIATIADLSARLKEAKELLFAYDAMDLHDEGCLGAYAGRELQCNCNLRDVREYKSKYASDINDKNL